MLTASELYALPILTAGRAFKGKYSEGEVYFTQYGKIYVFTHEGGERFRISRKGLGYFVLDGIRYYDNDVYLDLEPELRVKRSFEIESISNGMMHIKDDIFNGLLPF